MVPPMSATSFCSGSRSITGYCVAGRTRTSSRPPCRRRGGRTRPRPPAGPGTAQIGHLVLAGVADGHDLALDAPDAEPARHEDAVGRLQLRGDLLLAQRLGIHPDDLQVASVVDGGVPQRLDHAQIGVLQLARTCPPARCAPCPWSLLTFSTRVDPFAQLRAPGLQTQLVDHQAVETLVAQVEGHEVDVGRVDAADDRPGLDVGEQRDLLLEVLTDGPVGAAHDDVGLDTDAAQLVDAVLGRLGLELAARVDERDQRDVDVEDVPPADVVAELPDGLQEGQALDVAYRAADLGDDHVDVGVAGHPGDALLDLVGDVRDHLHGAAQVVALALLADDVVVDRAGGDVGVAA